jgi:hypothetical protein
MPTPEHEVADHRTLNGEGNGAYLHRLRVRMPSSVAAEMPLEPLGDIEFAMSWVGVEQDRAGVLWLSVSRYADSDTLHDHELGALSGELAEAWVRHTT